MRTQELDIMRLNIMNLFKKTRVEDGRGKRIECFARNESKTLINRVKTWPDARLTAVKCERIMYTWLVIEVSAAESCTARLISAS